MPQPHQWIKDPSIYASIGSTMDVFPCSVSSLKNIFLKLLKFQHLYISEHKIEKAFRWLLLYQKMPMAILLPIDKIFIEFWKKGWSILHVTQELWYDLTPNFDHVKTIFVIILSAHIALFYLSPNGEQWFAIMEGHCFNLNEEFTFPTNSWKDSSGTNEGVYEQCHGTPIGWRLETFNEK